jgi:hypothetical protein
MDVARKGDKPSEKALAAIRGVLRDHLLQIDVDLASLPPITPAELAREVDAVEPDPPRARVNPARHGPGASRHFPPQLRQSRTGLQSLHQEGLKGALGILRIATGNIDDATVMDRNYLSCRGRRSQLPGWL